MSAIRALLQYKLYTAAVELRKKNRYGGEASLGFDTAYVKSDVSQE